MSLGFRSVDVEAGAIVTKKHLDLVSVLPDGDPHVVGVGVFQRVHDALTSDVIHEQSDRGREFDLVDVGGVEPNVGVVACHLRDEAPERFRQTSATERRTMQVSNERADAVRRAVLGVLDLAELFLDLVDLAARNVAPRHVHLDRESEQELGEIVV
jgi:methylmalonyl-CoA mutase cobalamin-binding subunit